MIAWFVLSAAVLVLTACGSAPKGAARHHGTAVASVSRSPSSSSPGPLIADTAVDVATCHQFAAEQAGRLSAARFNGWFLRHGGEVTIGPASATGMDNALSTNLADWYAVHDTAPSGDLQTASYYAAEVRSECLSIGA